MIRIKKEDIPGPQWVERSFLASDPAQGTVHRCCFYKLAVACLRVFLPIDADGMFCPCLPALKLGLSLILRKLDLLSSLHMVALSTQTRPVLTNWTGIEIREVRPVGTL